MTAMVGGAPDGSLRGLALTGDLGWADHGSTTVPPLSQLDPLCFRN